MTSQSGQQKITIHIFSNISRSKDNQAMKLWSVNRIQEDFFASKIIQKMRH